MPAAMLHSTNSAVHGSVYYKRVLFCKSLPVFIVCLQSVPSFSHIKLTKKQPSNPKRNTSFIDLQTHINHALTRLTKEWILGSIYSVGSKVMTLAFFGFP